MADVSAGWNAPDFLRAWWLAQQLQQHGQLSPHLLPHLQALQHILNQQYQADPLGMPTWPPSPPPVSVLQQLQNYAATHRTVPFTERFPPGEHRADAFTGSPFDVKSGHLPGVTPLAPLWKI